MATSYLSAEQRGLFEFKVCADGEREGWNRNNREFEELEPMRSPFAPMISRESRGLVTTREHFSEPVRRTAPTTTSDHSSQARHPVCIPESAQTDLASLI